ncbi:PAS domain-containing sensor histidine kinase [Salinigranum marinum]|uniref:PAS domain-containing sensor histidine kinase n=1 Tax=Salinigranum marinum TaxID=1515595 RepID=UPI002989AED1|nr:ATP-binding protein [Salinigranum marinum]
MTSEPSTETLTEILALFDAGGEPRAATEVADCLGLSRRRTVAGLDRLVDRGDLAAKSVGTDGRVWWRPLPARADAVDDAAREAVQAGGRPLGEFADRAADAVWALDDRLHFSYANSRARELLDLDGAAVVGTDVRDVEALPDRLAAALVDTHRTREPVPIEAYAEPFDAWFEHRISPSETGLSVYSHDVSEHKRLERELRTEREQFRVALQNSPVVAFRLDTDLRYTWVGNPRAGFDAATVVGKRDDELLDSAAAETVMEPKRRVLETGEGVREEVTYELPTGEVTYDLTIEPLRDDSGEIVGLTAAALDITERKTHERELREREAELRRQNERLERFANVLSHDLRSPLTVADARLELLAGRTDETDHVDAIRRAHRRMATLIDDVLTLARQGNAVVETTAVPLRRVARLAWQQVATGDATLDVVTDRTVRANESRLQQLFENLFRNSVEHGSTGNWTATQSGDTVEHGSTSPRSPAREDSVEYAFTSSRPEADDSVGHASGASGGATDADRAGVTVRVGALDDHAGFSVADDGPGIPPGEREQVFDDAYSTGAGTGLGLAIVREIVESHGWTVTVTDGDEGGARFEIRGAR